MIVPAYNASPYIAETIQSILAQSRSADEIVVVDDGSTDRTREVVARFADKVTLVTKPNGGQGSARERGARVATAELLLFLDADDILLVWALEKLAGALQGDPQAALVYCPAQLWSPTDQIPPDANVLAEPDEEDTWGTLMRGNFIRTPGCVLIRRSALEEVGGWDPNRKLIGNEDWDLWLRVSEIHSFGRVDDPLLKYRWHHTGYSRSRLKMFRSTFAMLRKHRARWSGRPARRLAVETSEWAHWKLASLELRTEAKVAWSKGETGQAVNRFLGILSVGARPVLSRALKSGPARANQWLRNLFCDQKCC